MCSAHCALKIFDSQVSKFFLIMFQQVFNLYYNENNLKQLCVIQLTLNAVYDSTCHLIPQKFYARLYWIKGFWLLHVEDVVPSISNFIN